MHAMPRHMAIHISGKTDSTARWVPVPGYEGIYSVSDQGQVLSHARTNSLGHPVHEKTLTLTPNKRGHLRVSLSKNGRLYVALVHQIVLEAFVGPRPEKQEVRHLDGNPENNHLSNLRYGTRSENMYDRVRHGTHYSAKKTHCYRGHEFTEENTLRSSNQRRCRTCKREYERLQYRKKKEARNAQR